MTSSTYYFSTDTSIICYPIVTCIARSNIESYDLFASIINYPNTIDMATLFS